MREPETRRHTQKDNQREKQGFVDRLQSSKSLSIEILVPVIMMSSERLRSKRQIQGQQKVREQHTDYSRFVVHGVEISFQRKVKFS